MITEFAPAKVNLALHVTGQRADGYHLLDSLVVFVDVGDRVCVEPATGTTLRVTGPRASGVPTGPENLVLQAAQLFDQPVAITLDKHLPAQAGLGGGSADAAATLRAICRLTGQPMPSQAQQLSLGADVPVCCDATPKRMSGIGEHLTAWPKLPPLWAVLAHPGPGASTPAIFKGLMSKSNPPLSPWGGVPFLEWLAAQRNDLEAAARTLVPDIATVLCALNQTNADHVCMSGSGSACCALYRSADAAMAAASTLQVDHPDWWVEHGVVLA